MGHKLPTISPRPQCALTWTRYPASKEAQFDYAASVVYAKAGLLGSFGPAVIERARFFGQASRILKVAPNLRTTAQVDLLRQMADVAFAGNSRDREIVQRWLDDVRTYSGTDAIGYMSLSVLNPDKSWADFSAHLFYDIVASGGVAGLEKVTVKGGEKLLIAVKEVLERDGIEAAERFLLNNGIKGADLLPWYKLLNDGIAFNKAQWHRFPYNEVLLANGRWVDSYVAGREIVERKLTQLSDIQFATAKGYIDELPNFYPTNSLIATAPTTQASQLFGKRLTGAYVLEVPVQVTPIPRAVLDYATSMQVTIRDIAGKVYN